MLADVMAKFEVGSTDEWQECRLTIARFDGFLADTRKYGFTLVTVLLTANALIAVGDTAVDRPAASIVVMALLLALFMLDSYYWDLLRAAVERAITMEVSRIHISGVISTKARSSHATGLILAVYSLFVLVAAGIGVTAWFAAKPKEPWGIVVLALAVPLELAAMYVVYEVVSHPHSAVAKFVTKAWPFKSAEDSDSLSPHNT